MTKILVNGERHWKSVHQYSRQELKEWLDVLRNASGKEYQVCIKRKNLDSGKAESWPYERS